MDMLAPLLFDDTFFEVWSVENFGC